MNPMKRRDFLRNSALLTGGLLAVAPAAFAGGNASKLMTYDKVDQSLFEGINRAEKPETKLGKLHVPVIEVEGKIQAGKPFRVSIAIGETLHPMLPNHYIHWVDLFAGNAPVGRAEFWPELNEPQAVFTLKLDKPVTLIVREYCNIHGLWEHRRDLVPA